jgi:hypothetical protein
MPEDARNSARDWGAVVLYRFGTERPMNDARLLLTASARPKENEISGPQALFSRHALRNSGKRVFNFTPALDIHIASMYIGVICFLKS